MALLPVLERLDRCSLVQRLLRYMVIIQVAVALECGLQIRS